MWHQFPRIAFPQEDNAEDGENISVGLTTCGTNLPNIIPKLSLGINESLEGEDSVGIDKREAQSSEDRLAFLAKQAQLLRYIARLNSNANVILDVDKCGNFDITKRQQTLEATVQSLPTDTHVVEDIVEGLAEGNVNLSDQGSSTLSMALSPTLEGL